MFQKRSRARDYILIVIGVILCSVATKNIYDPAGMVTGGVSGIAIMLRKTVGLPLWLSNTLLNIPLFAGGYRVKGWRFIRRTLFATMLMSLVLMLLPEQSILPDQDLFLSAVFGGILMGVGAGLVFVAMATTGGTDLFAAILQTRLRQYSLPQIMQVLDALIVCCGIGIFGVIPALYAIVSIYTFSKISDGIIDGMHFAKAAYIISERSSEISSKILSELDRGVTGISSRGMYSDKQMEMLYCVLSNREIALVKDIIYETDPRAFVIISDVREVHGEGFTRDKEYA